MPMWPIRLVAPVIGCALFACGQPPVVPAATRAPRAEASIPPLPAAPPAPVASSPPAPAEAVTAACLTTSLRQRGRVAYAGAEAGALVFCAVEGHGAEEVRRCLRFDLATRQWGAGTVSFAREFRAPGHEAATAEARTASAAGTLTVCASAGRCITVLERPRVRGARDEVFGEQPAMALGGDRVLVANNGPPIVSADQSLRFAPALEVWDLKLRRRVKRAPVPSQGAAAALLARGDRALLLLCQEERCEAAVVDPAALRTTPLPVRLDRGGPGERIDLDLVQPVPSGGWALFDASGALVLWVDGSGKVARQHKLEIGDAFEGRAPLIGRVDETTAAVLPPAPLAGTVHLVGLEDGSVTTVVAPMCDAGESPSGPRSSR
jgi:hypothetical protein